MDLPDYNELNQRVRKLAKEMREVREDLSKLAYQSKDNTIKAVWIAYTAQAFDSAADALITAACKLAATFKLLDVPLSL